MVPQHTKPIEGEEYIMSVLTAYRDAIQLVHDQTVRYMNKGLYPDEITQLVQLPDHLYNHPFLQEFYGTVEWSVRAVFTHYMGWFSGKASELHPLAPRDAAEKLIDLGGGPHKVLEKAKEALDNEQHQWGLQLCDALIETEHHVHKAKVTKIEIAH